MKITLSEELVTSSSCGRRETMLKGKLSGATTTPELT